MDNDRELELEAEGFSRKNALYFALLSEIAYKSKDEAEAILNGDGDPVNGTGFGRFPHFNWFEVCI